MKLPQDNGKLIRRSFLWNRMQADLCSEDDCIRFLVNVFEALGVRVLDYRSTSEGRHHGSDERGKDIVLKANSFLNAYLGVQVKYTTGLRKEVTESEMAAMEAQLRKAANRKYRLDNEQVRIAKVYLIVFGGAKESARDYFDGAKQNLGLPCELWTTERIIELLVEQSNWAILSRHLNWEKDYDIWYELHRQNLLGKLKLEARRYAPVVKIPITENVHITYKPQQIPSRGFFLDAFSLEHALVYTGYRRELRLLADIKLRKPAAQTSLPILKVVGKSGVGKTSFLQAGLFHELVLTSNQVDFLPIVISCRAEWHSKAEIQSTIETAYRKLNASHDIDYLKELTLDVVVVLDQFERLLLKKGERKALLLSALQVVKELGARLIVSVRQDYLYETNQILRWASGRIKIDLDSEDISLSGLSRIDVDQFLMTMDSPVLTPIKDKILTYLWPNNHQDQYFDPARLQILLHFLLLLDSEERELAFADSSILSNFENLYLGVILNNYPSSKPFILEALLRYAVTHGSEGRISRRPFTRQELLRSTFSSKDHCDKVLTILIDTRILYRYSDKGLTYFELTHDRLAENLIASYSDLYSELRTVIQIESSISKIESGKRELPATHTLRSWLVRLSSIADDLSSSMVNCIQLLAYALGANSEPHPFAKYEPDGLPADFLNGLISAVAEPEPLIRILKYLERSLQAQTVDSIALRLDEVMEELTELARDEYILKFLAALSQFWAAPPPNLLRLLQKVSDRGEAFWSMAAPPLTDSIATYVSERGELFLNLPNIDEDLLFQLAPSLELRETILAGLLRHLEDSRYRWRVLKILGEYARRSEETGNERAVELIRTIQPAILDIVRDGLTAKDELVEQPSLRRELYYALKCLVFLRSVDARSLAISLALSAEDYRLRRVSGALYIVVCEEDGLTTLFDQLVDSVSSAEVKRGGDGGDPYRLRQTLFEILQMVWDSRLKIDASKKERYADKLRKETEDRLHHLAKFLDLTPTELHSGEVREPDHLDEDLVVLLLLLLASTGHRTNLDLFLKTLEPPICFAGAYDIPEAGLVGISKLCLNKQSELSEMEKKTIKTSLRKCIFHPHNGVSGRAVKIYQWIGSQEDLALLASLESNTIKNLRESSLLAREGIYRRSQNDWGGFFESDQFVRVWG